MENIDKVSRASVSTSAPVLSRLARRLVLAQLRQLASGTLVVREPGEQEQTLGDGEWAQAFQAAEHLVSRRQQKGDASAGLEAQRLDTLQRGHWQAVAHMMVRMRYL